MVDAYRTKPAATLTAYHSLVVRSPNGGSIHAIDLERWNDLESPTPTMCGHWVTDARPKRMPVRDEEHSAFVWLGAPTCATCERRLRHAIGGGR